MMDSNSSISLGSRRRSLIALNEKRIELLGECKGEVRRFALILFRP